MTNSFGRCSSLFHSDWWCLGVFVSVSVSFRWFAHFKPKHFAFYLSHFQHFRALHFIDTFFSLSLSLFVFPCACYFVYFFAKVLTPFLRSLITILQNCFSLSSQFYLLLCLALFLRCLADFFFLLYLFVCLFCTVCSILCLVVGCRFVCVSVWMTECLDKHKIYFAY